MISRRLIDFRYYTEGRNDLIDLSSVPLHMRPDYSLRNLNIEKGRKLCEKCDGTGNEIFAHYRRCTICGGLGIEKEK